MESVLLQGEEISDGVLIHTQRGGTAQAGSSKHPSLCECVTAVLTGACGGCTKQKIHVQGTHGTKWPLAVLGLILVVLRGKQTRLKTREIA